MRTTKHATVRDFSLSAFATHFPCAQLFVKRWSQVLQDCSLCFASACLTPVCPASIHVSFVYLPRLRRSSWWRLRLRKQGSWSAASQQQRCAHHLRLHEVCTARQHTTAQHMRLQPGHARQQTSKQSKTSHDRCMHTLASSIAIIKAMLAAVNADAAAGA